MSNILSRAEYAAQLAREALEVPGLPGAPMQEAAAASSEALPPEQPEGPALLRTWKLRTLKDAYEQRPPLEYVANGKIALGSLTIVFGAPGSLKSMILADLAVCTASGQPWLPNLDSTDSTD